MPVKHPCVNVCNGWSTHDGVCTGCFRDGDQTRDWNGYTEEQKPVATLEMKARKNKHNAEKLGISVAEFGCSLDGGPWYEQFIQIRGSN